MKLNVMLFFGILLICFTTQTADAQNRKYLLLEYIRLKPGITDSSSIIENTRKKLQLQNQKDHSVVESTVWENLSLKNKGYQYIVATVFKNFNDYLSEYKNRDSNVFYSLSKGRLDSVSTRTSDSFQVVYTPIFEMLAEAGSTKGQPHILQIKDIKASSGKENAYESLETTDWIPIHQDLIKKGYESAYGFNRLIFPVLGSPYNYNTLLFFRDEAMFEKQDDIDYEPYMRANQSAFINSGTLRTETNSELLQLVIVLNITGK